MSRQHNQTATKLGREERLREKKHEKILRREERRLRSREKREETELRVGS
jgi:hypothetical protein